ncbi:peptidase C14 caspase catalytic subunit p20 [Ferriphaselus amnicola]|uniref:Peptidase C14 caspase catalytic subunit p20 n=1 Tax=Ferriphaselus amnicola TaxID=1188319 RepID=A0A2Z6GAM9_9PROT|nr:caspase family protein [Ferriphaselus amnicola]BBE50497.1 peptidase C14 caspase catalytic subunit p20 [Ferriphaselus amnicola]
MLRNISIVCMVLVASWVSSAQASTGYALIVGVSHYPSLDERMQLDGPKYDSEMVAAYLKKQRSGLFRQENIKVLADGISGAQTPTKAAIQRGMDAIASKALEGDFVYLHFSGHGSQQPARQGDLSETDGRDELFLPADIGAWDDSVGTVKNALVDDEIGQLIGNIRKKGAFVWVVFDSCHSGTVTRGAPAGEDVHMRKVEPSALGIPQAAMDAADRNGTKTRGKGAAPESSFVKMGDSSGKAGGLVAFYAAQSTEQAPEMRLPQGEDGRLPHGLFTFTLLQTITEHPGITYRRAAQEVLQRYSALNMDRPTPLFEGDMDSRVFGSNQVDEKPQWPIEKRGGEIRIPAGNLSRLSSGSIVAFLDSPGADEKSAVGYAKVVNPTAMESVLQPIEYRGKKAISPNALPENGYARLVEQKMDLSLRVARPEWKDTYPKEARERIQKIMDSLKPEEGSGLRLQWVDVGQPADIRLAYAQAGSEQEQLWLLPPTGNLVTAGANKTPSIILKGKDDAQLKLALLDNLTRVARVVNLLRVSQGMGAGSSAMEVMLKVKRKADGITRELSATSIPSLYPGDEVHLLAVNTGRKPVDVNVLFVGSDYSISHWYKERIHPNGKLSTGLFRVSADSFGKERVIVVTNEAKPESEVVDLSFLAQKAMPKTRGNALTGMGALLQEAGFGGVKTRGVEPLGGAEEGGASSILQFIIDTAASLDM